jgi:hypothetical protein
MMDPSTRQKDGELNLGRRPGPKVNLLKELEIVVSLAKMPIQSSSPFIKSPLVSGGIYNLWEPMTCNVKNHSSAWPLYTKLEPQTHFPNEVNYIRSAVQYPSPRMPYDSKGIPEAYPNQWASWQSNQEPMKPTVFEHCPPMRCNPCSNGFRKSTTHALHTPSVPETHSSSKSPGSHFDYGFIGGPAVDLLSGAVISPRRHQLSSSPTSSEESMPPQIPQDWAREDIRRRHIKFNIFWINAKKEFGWVDFAFLNINAWVWLNWTASHIWIQNSVSFFRLPISY